MLLVIYTKMFEQLTVLSKLVIISYLMLIEIDNGICRKQGNKKGPYRMQKIGNGKAAEPRKPLIS